MQPNGSRSLDTGLTPTPIPNPWTACSARLPSAAQPDGASPPSADPLHFNPRPGDELRRGLFSFRQAGLLPGRLRLKLKDDDDEIGKLFAPLFDDLRGEDCFPNRRPLLTHYTSIVGLEAISTDQ
jgi:hypothetical protein